MEDWMNDLELTDFEDEQGEQFTIDDDAKADWAIRKIREREKECERLNAVRDERIASLERAKEREVEKMRHSTQGLRSLLQQYFDDVDKKETKTQFSYALPSGKLLLKKGAVKPEHDDDAILNFLLTSLDYSDMGLTETKTALRWGELKKLLVFDGGKAYMKTTGEEVPGVTYGVTEPEFVVKAED